MEMTETYVLELLRAACVKEKTQQEWAKKNGFSSAFISDVLNGRRKITESICTKLGIERVIIYRPIRVRIRKGN
jgi:plasmid maintenance system antidote protein VapI